MNAPRSGGSSVVRETTGASGLYRKAVEHEFASRGWTLDDSVLVLERPLPGLADLLETARLADTRRIVCGFLPDEVPWSMLNWTGAMDFLAERFEFFPLTLRDHLPSGVQGVHVLSVREAGTAAGAVADGFADSLADILGLTCRKFAIADVGLEDWPGMMDGARVVVNAIDNWALGFALDTCAYRQGATVVRTAHPGYSPLRYGILGVDLPPVAANGEVTRLRSRVTDLLKRDGTGPKLGDWPASSEAWRHTYQPNAYASFWSKIDLPSMFDHDGSPVENWLDRPLSWSALAGILSSTAIPERARERTLRQVSRWISEQRGRSGRGGVADIGAGRLARLFPDWLRLHRETAGEQAEQVVRWTTFGATWISADRSALPMLERAEWSWRRVQSAEARAIAGVSAWARPWSDLPSRYAWDGELMPGLRSAAIEAVVNGPNSWGSSATRDLPIEVTSWFGSKPELWGNCFGAAAPLAGLYVGLRGRSCVLAQVFIKQIRQLLGLACVADLRSIAFAALPEPSDRLEWLQVLATKDTTVWASEVEVLMLRWLIVRRTELWRRRITDVVRRELSCALRLSERSVTRGEPRSSMTALYARVAALSGRVRQVQDAWLRVDATDRPALVWPVVAALWLRGNASVSSELLGTAFDLTGQPEAVTFNMALARQLSGDSVGAASALETLKQAGSDLFRHTGALREVQLIWLAVLFKRSGRIDLSEQLIDRAGQVAGDWRSLCDETGVGDESVGPVWLDLADVRVCL